MYGNICLSRAEDNGSRQGRIVHAASSGQVYVTEVNCDREIIADGADGKGHSCSLTLGHSVGGWLEEDSNCWRGKQERKNQKTSCIVKHHKKDCSVYCSYMSTW